MPAAPTSTGTRSRARTGWPGARDLAQGGLAQPAAEDWWERHQSIQIVQRLFEGRMYPLTLAGLDAAIRGAALTPAPSGAVEDLRPAGLIFLRRDVAARGQRIELLEPGLDRSRAR